MPVITLPVPGVTPDGSWAPLLNTAITDVNTQVDTNTAAIATKITAFADPNADRIVFWDDSASAFVALSVTSPVTISGTALSVAAASSTAQGIVELATTTEATTGTDTTRAVTAAGVKAVADTKAALAHTHAASDIASGTVATARLGSGAADSTKFLRGDQTWATPAGGGGSTPSYPFAATSTWRTPVRITTSNPVTLVAGRLNLYPIIIPVGVNVDGLAFNISTLGASSTTTAAIYSDTGDFFPGTLLANTSALSSATTGIKSETFTPVALSAGVYWVGCMALVAQVQIHAIGWDGTSALDNWSFMPYGTGSTPTGMSSGNPAPVAFQTGLSALPSTFAGSYETAGSSAARGPGITMRLARA